MRYGQRRNAVTLMEVLVATFILSIGLISVIAMFPVGAKNMVDSIKNERTAQAAHNFDAMMRVVWKDLHTNPDGTLQSFAPAALAGFDVDATGAASIAGDPNGPSSPLLFDPLGYATHLTYNPGPNADQIGQKPQFIRRIGTVGYPASSMINLRSTCLPDDMSFSVNGEPLISGGQIDRGYRYNVAYMLQRPVNSNIYEANLWVLAFDGRPYNDVASQDAVFDSGSSYSYIDSYTSQIDFSAMGQRPPLKKGGWVMIASQVRTMYAPAGQPSVNTLRWHVDFVRVASIDEVSATTLQLGYERPVNTPSGVVTLQRLVVFEHLAEVFTRGKVSPNIGQVW